MKLAGGEGLVKCSACDSLGIERFSMCFNDVGPGGKLIVDMNSWFVNIDTVWTTFNLSSPFICSLGQIDEPLCRCLGPQ